MSEKREGALFYDKKADGMISGLVWIRSMAAALWRLL